LVQGERYSVYHHSHRMWIIGWQDLSIEFYGHNK
jgi:hypothetical protein